MSSRPAWLGLGAGVYLAATLAAWPAGTAYRWFAPAGIEAAGISGTVWRGSAAVASIAGLGLYDVEWAIRPLSLLTGSLAIDVRARQPDGFIDAAVRAGLGTVRITDLRGTTSLRSLSRVIPLGDVTGLLSLQLDSLEIEDGWPRSAVGQIRLAQLETPLLMPGGPSGLIPLGNFVVSLEETGSGEVAGQFTDQGGPLEVSGRFRLSEDHSYELSGLIRARDSAAPEIVQGLQFVTGAPDESGRRPFELSGSL
jgi:general secretion pathway protein N